MLFYPDEAAAVYAYGLVGKGVNLVTYRFGEIIFRRPVKWKEVMNFCEGEPSFSHHSVSFKLRVDVEGRGLSGDRCCDGECRWCGEESGVACLVEINRFCQYFY